MYIEPQCKNPGELWTVESGDCPSDHTIHATFTERADAEKYRNSINNTGPSSVAYIGKIAHNPS